MFVLILLCSCLTTSQIKVLYDAAHHGKSNSYSPYSNFKVGASVMLENGEIFSGCNIENAAYSPTICAERSAISKLVSELGPEYIRKNAIVAVAVVSDSKTAISPCGPCRQVIREFASPTGVSVFMFPNTGNRNKDISKRTTRTVAQLLPMGFGPENLGKPSFERTKDISPATNAQLIIMRPELQ
eukprot:NODE_295_length_10520_cov_1.134344.p5 type:complete len:185 gc:universal NODE_295_length_10520_cov_1.134344:5172-4618(-)